MTLSENLNHALEALKTAHPKIENDRLRGEIGGMIIRLQEIYKFLK